MQHIGTRSLVVSVVAKAHDADKWEADPKHKPKKHRQRSASTCSDLANGGLKKVARVGIWANVIRPELFGQSCSDCRALWRIKMHALYVSSVPLDNPLTEYSAE